MNILYLLFSFTTGGTERLVSDICNEMVKRDHRVHLYVVNDLHDEKMLDSLDDRITVHLQNRKTGSGSKLQTLIGVSRYMRRNKIDVVHCNSLDAPELLLLKPLLAPRVKVLYTIHGMHQLKAKSKLHILLRNFLCHRVIAISQCVKEDILSAGIAPKKVVTVPNAIDLVKFPTSSVKQFDPTMPVIGNVARILPSAKGQDILIQAVGILKGSYPNIRCLFAGAPAKGHPEELQKLTSLTKELGLEQNICFLGNVDDVPGFLNKIDIFALPSRSEGFGISLVEAMAMGIPCVASNLEGPTEVLCGGAKGLLFKPEDPQDLAKKLAATLQDYSAYKAAATDNIQYVHNQYAIGIMCDRLEALMLPDRVSEDRP